MNLPAKCATPACNCVPADGKKYCSTFCAEATPVTEVICQCKHIECENLRH